MISTILVALWLTATATEPHVPPIVPKQPPIQAQDVPNFRDTKAWIPFRAHAGENFIVHSHAGIRWGIAYFYTRSDYREMGIELAFSWAPETPIYKIWGRTDEVPYQTLLQKSGWTTPIRGNKMAFTLNLDMDRKRVLDATLMLYLHNAEEPVVSEMFENGVIQDQEATHPTIRH